MSISASATLASNFIPAGITVQLQSENGMLGMGPFPFEGEEDPDLINAGKQTITELPTTSYFDSAQSFGMIRGGILTFQSWERCRWPRMVIRKLDDPGQDREGNGRAMDPVAGVKRVIVLMEHTAP
jgi:3-oxoacid CoA-transferase subunit B